MRVLNVIQKAQRRGAETFACDLSWWLRRQGHQARVVALYPHAGPSPLLDAEDVVLHGRENSLAERVLDPSLLIELVGVIREFRPDVVQCNGGRTLKYAAAARRLTPPATWVYRNIDSPRFWLKSRRARWLMPPLVRAGFDAAIGVSDATLVELRATYGFHGASVVIENGVDFSRVAVRGTSPLESWGDAGGRLIWVGALGPQKRPDVAIEVLARLPTSTTLTLVGEGPWRHRVEALVASRGLVDRVRLVGNRNDVGDLMRAADLLLMTSDTEGIPAVVIEAQHCGLPVVAYDVGGLRECVSANGPGMLVPHGDIDSLVAAVRMASSHAASTDVRLSCSAFAERFSIERIGPRYLAFFEEQLSRRGGGG